MSTFKFSAWAASMSIVALGGMFTGACGGGGADTTGGTTSGTPRPTGGTLTPPAVNDGTGKPADATDATCQSAFDCELWSCDCSDGYFIYAAFCLNGYCLNASGACPNACTTPLWDHGTWTGTTGIGPEIAGAAATSGDSGVGGGWSSSGGNGGSTPEPTCSDSGAPCSDSSECCSYFCNFDTCN